MIFLNPNIHSSKLCWSNNSEYLSWNFQTQVEVALAAADGDLNVAVEILMNQQVYISCFVASFN